MSQLALSLPDLDAEPPQPLRALDTVEAETSECRTCGGPAEFRAQTSLGLRDYCEAHVPLTFGEFPRYF